MKEARNQLLAVVDDCPVVVVRADNLVVNIGRDCVITGNDLSIPWNIPVALTVGAITCAYDAQRQRSKVPWPVRQVVHAVIVAIISSRVSNCHT